MTRTHLTRGKLARALELLGRAPAVRPLPTETEKISGAPTGPSTFELEERLVEIGERARPLHGRSSDR